MTANDHPASDTCFTLSVDNRVAHIQLCRPERRNAMTLSFWDELPRLIEQIEPIQFTIQIMFRMQNSPSKLSIMGYIFLQRLT